MIALPLRGTGRVGIIAEGWICQACRHRSLHTLQRQRHDLAIQPQIRVRHRPAIATSTPVVKSHRRHKSQQVDVKSQRTRKAILPDAPARTRFAPSPTGHLHIGGLRTAIFSYLLAKRTGGQFILRIEDTDQKRLVPGAEERLIEDLRWAGVEWDEGPGVDGPYGPYKQSQRTEIYQRHAKELLDSGAAYRCFCSPQKSEASFITSGCHGDCASLAKDQSEEKAKATSNTFTIRLKTPPDAHKRKCPDLVYGKIPRLKRSPAAITSDAGESGEIAGDAILVKSDGTPTYHLANVVDDHLMGITHVIRGSEWMASTPLHYDLYHAFGWTPPAFAHVGLLVDENKAKLSKRNSGGVAWDVRSMREELEVLPVALCNFLTLLGWSNPTRSDVKDMAEQISDFDLKFTQGNVMVNTTKLWHLQKHHVARRCAEVRQHPEKCAELLGPILERIHAALLAEFPDIHSQLGETDPELRKYITDVLLADSQQYTTSTAFIGRNRYFFRFVPSTTTTSPTTTSPPTKSLLLALDLSPAWRLPRDTHLWFDTVSAGLHETLDATINEEIKDVGQRKQASGAVMKFLRHKLAGGMPGPSVGVVMALLGREECVRRLGA